MRQEIRRVGCVARFSSGVRPPTEASPTTNATEQRTHTTHDMRDSTVYHSTRVPYERSSSNAVFCTNILVLVVLVVISQLGIADRGINNSSTWCGGKKRRACVCFCVFIIVCFVVCE